MNYIYENCMCLPAGHFRSEFIVIFVGFRWLIVITWKGGDYDGKEKENTRETLIHENIYIYIDNRVAHLSIVAHALKRHKRISQLSCEREEWMLYVYIYIVSARWEALCRQSWGEFWGWLVDRGWIAGWKGEGKLKRG